MVLAYILTDTYIYLSCCCCSISNALLLLLLLFIPLKKSSNDFGFLCRGKEIASCVVMYAGSAVIGRESRGVGCLSHW